MTVAKKMAGTMMALLLCAGGAGAQQMYKWVDASGKVTFSDKPPPANAKPIEIKAGAGGAATVPLPYALAQAVRAHPVVLYTRNKCDYCDQGRTFLKERGIPFIEKTVQTGADEIKLKEAGGDGRMPFIKIGRAKSTGFEPAAWNSMLTDAAYPEKKILPSGYQYAKPSPASPPEPEAPKTDDKGKPGEADRKGAPAPAPGEKTAPPGFVF
ncbi:glutaredoxin family protein [Massilia sp. CCM 8734]|uniref:glutaredoxin family protein n=1 Tax=Massilia sp. CCM 8734 TaxID=2609283 RepID=UPI001423AD09|nr:glutaredoxin family protein [Massilia sp. CCM 8734]NIA00323.1 DUF4124 domain-containing protein [Massilia sp. CCM 8734]